MKEFDCDDVGELTDYVGCKIDINKEEGWLRMTQPVLLQSFEDEFGIDGTNATNTPAIPGSVLQYTEGDKIMNRDEMFTFRSGTGKLLHLMKWSRPEIKNAVRELSRFMAGATQKHMKAMKRVMSYCVGTKERGLFLKPNARWDGKDKSFPFEVGGRCDSDYAKDPMTRRSVSGYSTSLCGAPVTTKSKMQGCVTLSVTEAELVAATECAQDMLFVMRVLESMELTVKKPMILQCNNKGAIDLVNSWSVAGRTRHVSTKIHFLRALKEEGILLMEHVPTKKNSADLFTKNLNGPQFEQHTEVYCGPLDVKGVEMMNGG
jgi:hypothetical protein